MADIAKFSVKGLASVVDTPGAGADSFTIPLGGGDSRGYLVVDNNDAAVEIKVNVDAGDGLRSVLGDLDVVIAAGKAGVIPFNDSMRFKVNSTGKVTVNITDTAGTAVSAASLAKIACIYIQG